MLHVSSKAQTGNFVLNTYSHNFGFWREDKGVAQFSFEITNTSNKKILIHHVKASCGCTTPQWSLDSLSPQEVGFIKVSYNPFNRPGEFNKKIFAKINGDSITLNIKGVVIVQNKKIEDEFPDKIGNIRFQSNYVNFGVIKNNQLVSKEIQIYNQGQKPIFINTEIYYDFFTVSGLANKLFSGKTGFFKIDMVPTKKIDLGNSDLVFNLRTDDDILPNKTLHLIVNVEEYFPPLSDTLLKLSPRIFVKNKYLDGGKIDKNTIRLIKFPIKNIGQELLVIKQIKSNCTCIKTVMPIDKLISQEEVFLELFFDPKERDGREEKMVTIYSNDPFEPVLSLRFRIEVE